MTTKKKKTKSFWIVFFNVLSGLPQDERRQEEGREFLYWTLTVLDYLGLEEDKEDKEEDKEEEEHKEFLYWMLTSCQPFRVT